MSLVCSLAVVDAVEFFTWVSGCAPYWGSTNTALWLFLFLLMSFDLKKKQTKKLLSFSSILCSFSSWLAISQGIFQDRWVWKNTGVERKLSEISVFKFAMVFPFFFFNSLGWVLHNVTRLWQLKYLVVFCDCYPSLYSPNRNNWKSILTVQPKSNFVFE